MKAPDKITLSKYNITNNGDVVFAWLTNSPDCEPMNHPVEYIRADTFIYKAATWFANRYQANGSYLNADDIEDFIKTMRDNKL